MGNKAMKKRCGCGELRDLTRPDPHTESDVFATDLSDRITVTF